MTQSHCPAGPLLVMIPWKGRTVETAGETTAWPWGRCPGWHFRGESWSALLNLTPAESRLICPRTDTELQQPCRTSSEHTTHKYVTGLSHHRPHNLSSPLVLTSSLCYEYFVFVILSPRSMPATTGGHCCARTSSILRDNKLSAATVGRLRHQYAYLPLFPCHTRTPRTSTAHDATNPTHHLP